MIATEVSTDSERQAEIAWQKWQAEHAARRAAKGYDQPVSDEEAADVLG